MSAPTPSHQHTAPNDRVGLGAKTAYGLGGLAENTMHNSVNNMANPVFNVGLGVAPALIGIATSVFRLWDAITDPVMGIISDRFESRFGRRKPFIVLGAIVSALFFIAIWCAALAGSPLRPTGHIRHGKRHRHPGGRRVRSDPRHGTHPQRKFRCLSTKRPFRRGPLEPPVTTP